MQYSVYMLLCADGKFYTGMTSDLRKRISQHHAGLAGYTSKHLPVKLVWSAEVGDKRETSMLEQYIKHLSYRRKVELYIGLPKITRKVDEVIIGVRNGELVIDYHRK